LLVGIWLKLQFLVRLLRLLLVLLWYLLTGCLMAINLIHIECEEVGTFLFSFMKRIEGLHLGFQGLHSIFEMIRILLWVVLERTLSLGCGLHGTDPSVDHHLLVLFHQVFDSFYARLLFFPAARLVGNLI